ncbi:hypothetical protein PUR29_32880 [Methylobacterium ajmalii]|uniref:Uncharacterized protein n=1 Tax=Methylobacterium ajmalii TaxID=2738439 RepID=A0ABV0A4D0_9HYPH
MRKRDRFQTVGDYAERERQKAELAQQARTAPGPEIPLCCECGRPAIPAWGDADGTVYGPCHAPGSLRRPS